MAEWKVSLPGNSPQIITRGTVQRSAIDKAQPHNIPNEGPGWQTSEGDGILEQIFNVTCLREIG